MPSWARQSESGHSIERHRHRPNLSTIVLVSFGLMALSFHVAKLLLFQALVLYDLFLLASWLLLLLTLSLNRPTTAPSSLLLFYVFEIVAMLSRVIPWTSPLALSVILQLLIVACCFSSIITILCMPIQPLSSAPDQINDPGYGKSENTTPEDTVRLFQYFAISWVWPLLVVGKQRQLQKEDIWTIRSEIRTNRLAAVYASLRQSTVFRKLLHANALDVCTLSAITCIQLVLEFSSPILLHQFLYVIEKPNLGKQPAVLYALLLLARGVISLQLFMLRSWYGRRCFERTCGLLSMIVYRKTLSRKNIASMKPRNTQGSVNGSRSIGENGANRNGEVQNSEPSKAAIFDKAKTAFKAPTTYEKQQGKLAIFKELLWPTENSTAKPTDPASKGQVLNIVRSDAIQVASCFQDVSRFIQLPIGLLIAVWLIWDLLGPSCLLGVLVLATS